ncbi:MAG: hypothetical protein RLZZ156_1602 [Deinococcota bacterium]|jgi:hypothetical protein
MKQILIGLGLFSSFVLAQNGFISSYHPFPNAKKIPVQSCKSNATGFSCPHGRVLVQRTVQGKPQVTLDIFGQRFPIRFATMPNDVFDVWNSDLNLDGKADVIVKLSWGGNGIIADGNLTIFALSSAKGHQLSTLEMITFDPNALIFLRGKPTVLHTALVSGDSKRTGRTHNFWVFHPLEVQGSKLLKNQDPIWIQYTNKPSHLRTNKLLALEKQMALKANPIQFFIPMR